MSNRPSPARTAVQPKVSVVLVNWNRYDDIMFALAALRRVTYPNIEIIVVDNNSEDGSPERLLKEPDVALVRLCRNCGPSEARNVGMQAAEGKYIFLLDSDAVVAPETISVLVDRMEGEDDLGILGCRILNYHSRRIDQWVYSQPYASHGNRPFDTYSFSAAGAMIRASTLKQVGGFWERLFIYNEEVDLAVRVLRAGYRVAYEPDAHVLHRPSSNGRVNSANYFYYQVRNWIWIFFRHYPFWARWRKIGMYSSMYLIKGVLNRHPLAAIKGVLAGLLGIDAVSEFPEKMSYAEARRMDELNRGRKLRVSLLRTGTTSEPLANVNVPAPSDLAAKPPAVIGH
ncbi:MAG TPA: glycosyltransferase family 2 protein [Tepidisphaeraceae bacterium]|jgi:hypothetical protein